MAFFILVIYMFSISLLCASDFIGNRKYISKNAYFSSHSFKLQLYNYFFNDEIGDIKVLKTQDDKKGYRSSDESVRFYIIDKEAGKTYTNAQDSLNIDDYIKNKSMYVENFPKDSANDPYIEYINNWFIENNFKGEFIILKDADGHSNIKSDYKYYSSIRRRIIKEGIIGISSLVLGIILFVLIKRTGKENYISRTVISYKKIPFDIRIFMFIVYTFAMIYLKPEFTGAFFCLPIRAGHFFKLTFVSLYTFYIIVNIKSAADFVKYKDERSLEIGESLVVISRKLKKESPAAKNTIRKIKLILFATMFLGVIFVMVFREGRSRAFSMIIAFYVFLYIVFVPQYIIKKMAFFKDIIEGTQKIASGDLNYFINETGKGSLPKLAHNINCMKDGFKKSVQNELKSEKLKSELITNVSHDLKTPLTSIINYVDLLKKEDLSNEEALKYIDILDKKSQRLKILIEDLFDASKLASGSVELNMQKIDIVALVRQALGEFDEKINKSQLTFRFNASKQNIYVNLDGNKTWRVFDNLINNALKYSQPATRVYIDIYEEENGVSIIMKNVSSYEMDFDPEEISERLKRGDKSRNTEGSGLGLAIAKNIVEVEGGRFHIDIDGDLFKVVIEFKK